MPISGGFLFIPILNQSANFVGSVVGFLNVCTTRDLQVIRLVASSLPRLCGTVQLNEFQLVTFRLFTALLKFEFHCRLDIIFDLELVSALFSVKIILHSTNAVKSKILFPLLDISRKIIKKSKYFVFFQKFSKNFFFKRCRP